MENNVANSKKNILVLDNDPNILHTVRFHLKMVGYQVFTTDNPVQAIQLLEDQIIHLAIIGADPINDREYSGLEVAKQTPKHIPFFINSAYEDMLAIKEIGR